MWGTENWGLVAIGGGASLIANILYQLGGIGNKWLRRYVAPVILALAANLIALFLGTWAWQLILILPCLIAGFSLGYGASTTAEKILRRTIYAAGVLTACFCGLWATGFTISGWVVFGLTCLTGITSVVLGVLNPFNNARAEEFMVCQVLTLYIPFWAFVR
jgi:hypothetical protein